MIKAPSITPVELLSMICTPDVQQCPLVIDCRTSEQHVESEMRLDSLNLVWIPGDEVTPGVLTKQLRSKIAVRQQSLFDARANYAAIVLFDWNTTYSTLTPSLPISIVKDAVYKWDQQVSCRRV